MSWQVGSTESRQLPTALLARGYVNSTSWHRHLLESSWQHRGVYKDPLLPTHVNCRLRREKENQVCPEGEQEMARSGGRPPSGEDFKDLGGAH
jgi:hypothetical protein